MPKLVSARAARDEKDEHQIRKLAGSRHAPADWILRAEMIVGGREGKRTRAIAAAVSSTRFEEWSTRSKPYLLLLTAAAW